MGLSDDPRNAARGVIEEVSGELGDYLQTVFQLTIENEQFQTAQNDSAAAAAFVAWLADNIQE